jgi:adenylate kinase
VSVYVLVGAPGAGKGTQAQILSEHLGVPHVASGDLFREEVKAGTALGRELDSYMSQGALVPDELTTRVVLDRLARADAVNGAILDGFPRTRRQAEALDAALAKLGTPLAGALYIRVREPDLMRRLSGRWVCRASGHPYHTVYDPPRVEGICDQDGSALYQREDDRPETVRARLDQQLPSMYDVVDYYRGRGILAPVDGEGTIDEVNAALNVAIRDRPGENSLSAAGGSPVRRS